MNEAEKMIVDIKRELGEVRGDIGGLRGEFAEYKEYSTRTIGEIQETLHTGPRERTATLIAVITTVVSVVTCISRFIPAGRL